MSSPVSQATNAVAKYTSILLDAQKAFDENLVLLKKAADNASEGSIAHQIGQLDTKTKEMNETPRTVENYATLKDQFFQFMSAQLDKYETAQKTKKGGLAAIATLTNAQAVCVTNYPKPAELLVIKKHMLMLGSNETQLDKAQKLSDTAIAAYKFDAQLQELTPLVAKVTEQIALLEGSLDKAFYAKKEAEGRTGYLDLIPSYNYSYLLAAVAEKNQPSAPIVAEKQKQDQAAVNG